MRFLTTASMLIGVTAGFLALNAVSAHAASIVNRDGEVHTIYVTEGGSRQEILVAPDETITACEAGCFMTMPNGDREVLSGQEAVEIVGGAATIQ